MPLAVLFFRLISPFIVHLRKHRKDETGRGCSPVQFLWCCDRRNACDRRCFVFFISIAQVPRPEV